jgi:hypothetical protein
MLSQFARLETLVPPNFRTTHGELVRLTGVPPGVQPGAKAWERLHLRLGFWSESTGDGF